MYDSVVDALLDNASKIGQLVVVTPQGGGGGQLFGRGGGGSGARLSPLEAKVAASGANYLIVRAAPSDRVTDRYGEQANLVVAPAGGLPSGLQASRAQVGFSSACAAVDRWWWGMRGVSKRCGPGLVPPPVQQVVQRLGWLCGSTPRHDTTLPGPPDLLPVFRPSATRPRLQVAAAVAQAMAQASRSAVIEVGASPAAPATSLASAVAQALAGGAQQEEVEEEEEAPAPTPAKTVFGFGTRKISKPAPVAVEEEEEEEEGEWGRVPLLACIHRGQAV